APDAGAEDSPGEEHRLEDADGSPEEADADDAAQTAELSRATEAEASEAVDAGHGPRPGDRYAGLAALISRAGGEGPVPRATLTLDPADRWTRVAADALEDLGPDRGAIVVAPDQRDVARLAEELTRRGL